MNERIKLLAEQAFCYSCEFAQGPDYNPHNPYNLMTQQTRYDSKFAELIVRECVSVIDKTDPPGYNDYPDYRDQIEESFRRECATEIKLHFGVEE